MSLSSTATALRRLGSSDKSVERFDRCLFAEPANVAPFFKAALLINTDIGRHDLYGVKMGVDPFNDLPGSRCAANVCRLDVHGIGNTDRHARPQ